MGCEHDGDRLGRLSGGADLGRRGCENDVDLHAYKFRCQIGQLLDPFRPAKLDDNTLALDITEVAQAHLQRRYPIRPGGGTTETKESDPRDLRRLLRARRQRPRSRCTANERYELAPPHHSITSSARASRVGGTVRPSILAVLRLMTSSNLVGC